MTSGRRSFPVRVAALFVLVLLVPPVRRGLEATMTAQMLVQMPLLVAAGWMLSRGLPPRVLAKVEPWNYRGIAGLILATVVSTFWMLPRSLDAATNDPLMAAAKYLSVPLLIGLPFAVSWPRMGFVVRGVFLAEFVATFFRLGWLYRVSPLRLCNNYGLNDQRRLGGYLLAVGGALLVWLAWKLLWGRFESLSRDGLGWPRRTFAPEVTARPSPRSSSLAASRAHSTTALSLEDSVPGK